MKTYRPACPSPGHPDVEEAYQTWLDVAALYRQIIHAQFDMALPPSYPSDSLGDVLTLAHNRFLNACTSVKASRSVSYEVEAEQDFWRRLVACGADVRTCATAADPAVLPELIIASAAMLRHVPAGTAS